MKKAIFSIIISLILVLTVTGCSNSVANKYDNVKDLLGESILYEVKYKNGDIKKFERKIKYTE